MPRLLIVANRAPLTASIERGQMVVRPSSGGLVSALQPVREGLESIWIGSLADLPAMSPALRRQFEWQLTSHGVTPVALSAAEVQGFYEQVSNGVLWPVSHCLLDNLPLEMSGWPEYRAVNERFADTVASLYRDGDLIWVHDYQLMLVPGMLRERLPNARIGYFHHIPFPPPEVFRVLPWRDEILAGLLGADLIGFQTDESTDNFERLRADLPSAFADTSHQSRGPARAETFPISIEVAVWERLAGSLEAVAETTHLRTPGMQILVGVDRLDYTKGILRRLLAFERLLETQPALQRHVRFIQVTVPTRDEIPAYVETKRRVDEIVGSINGRFGTAHWMPIHRIHGHLSAEQLAGLYRAADVLLVTPLRDGMNLVAKEFVATRTDGDGVLLLSEFAGAAKGLPGALLVNPFDVESVTSAISQALSMPPSERQERVASMRRALAQNDVRGWANDFISGLDGFESVIADGVEWDEPVALPV